MIALTRPEHLAILHLLTRLRSDLLLESECWFAGGTAIVLRNGEYRVSRDVDFLCASQSGYRNLRLAVTRHGVAGLFKGSVTSERDFRCDQYGLRGLLGVEGHSIKFEIVREARIALSGSFDPEFGCPVLGLEDQFAEKLLANADRGNDPSTDYRDAIDLGMLALRNAGRIPDDAAAKSVQAYGSDIWHKARSITDHLATHHAALRRACENLQMDLPLAETAIDAVRHEVRRLDALGG